MNSSLAKFLFSLAVCFLAAYVGSIFTPEPGAVWYYQELVKPSWNPPDWVFPPVWSLLFFLMAVSLWLVMKKNADGSVYGIFALQLVLNMAWSATFFGLQQPFYAFIVIILLWLSIVVTIARFKTVSPLSAYLFVLYLLWVSFALCLNFVIWRLNP